MYEQLLERLVKGAEYLSNPLLRDEDREKAMKLYDEIDKQIESYQKENRKDWKL